MNSQVEFNGIIFMDKVKYWKKCLQGKKMHQFPRRTTGQYHDTFKANE